MTENEKNKLVKRIAALIVISVNVLLWAKPCDLAYNVAQQRDILLGRYTIEQTTTLILLIPVSLLIIKGIWSGKKVRSQKEKRERLFKTVALSVSIVFAILIVDIFLRVVQHQRYIGSRSYYHRAPNTIDRGINKDVPATAFSYPGTAPGYPDVPYALTVDKRGFRNKTDLQKYDLVALGDSFTEGSHVSDEQAWPVIFAQRTNLTVYNLGMSGGSPVTYLETLKKFGLQLSPKTVVCMIYEGNDFRGSNFVPDKHKNGRTLENLFRTSPLRQAIKSALIRSLGPVNAGRFSKQAAPNPQYTPSDPLYAVSWLPLPVPDGSGAKYYAFKLKRLLSHFVTKDELLESGGCQALLAKLRKIHNMCSENNVRLILVYAPDKPHVLLPLVRDVLPAEKLRAFMALKEKRLPAAKELMDILVPRLQIHESVTEEFCRAESIEFVSLTEPLREEILKGSQVYYTHDQHWTPIGQKIAAQTLSTYVKSKPTEKQ
ncbi:MAG TPA: SGNH/GDSL hydrolase family protein [Sedimentisphaerales bacterium]|nr:SGNH/GDSL hydrolase family protein [Sedimentisphaerales bacterium]